MNKSVILIHYNEAGQELRTPKFMALAENREAALKWIQDEVDGRHDSPNMYAKGIPAAWWVEHGTFVLTKEHVFREDETTCPVCKGVAAQDGVNLYCRNEACNFMGALPN